MTVWDLLGSCLGSLFVLCCRLCLHLGSAYTALGQCWVEPLEPVNVDWTPPNLPKTVSGPPIHGLVLPILGPAKSREWPSVSLRGPNRLWASSKVKDYYSYNSSCPYNPCCPSSPYNPCCPSYPYNPCCPSYPYNPCYPYCPQDCRQREHLLPSRPADIKICRVCVQKVGDLLVVDL